MCYRFQEYNQALADRLAEFFRVSIAEVPRNCLTFVRKRREMMGLRVKGSGGEWGGEEEHLHRSLQTKVALMGSRCRFQEEKCTQQMPKNK